MCSNTSSISGAGDSADNKNGDYYGTHILKKPKRQRVPKRGPGVAELEKILREQETSVVNADKGNVPFVPDNHTTINLPPIRPPQPPPLTMPYGSVGINRSTFSGSCGCNDVQITESGMIFPEETPLLPRVRNSCESSIYKEAPKMPSGYPISTSFVNGSDQMHILQKKQYPLCHQYPSPTINLFPQTGSLHPPEKQPATGFSVHVEPPSNQRSSNYNYSYMLPEEEMIAGTKRSRTFTMENTLGSASASAPPLFHCQASSSIFNGLRTLDYSPSFSNHTASSTGFNLQCDETLSRGDYGAMGGNFSIFGSPATPFTRHSSLPFQGSSSDPPQKVKPFYSFLIPEEQTSREEEETTLSLNNERTRRDTIDLNLKL